jgi:ribosomal-protein-alanine N-acetyltransferase
VSLFKGKGKNPLPHSEQPSTIPNILLESARLLIRRPEQADLAIYLRLFSNAAIMHYLGGPWTHQQTTEALREWREVWGVKNRWYGSLVRKDTQECIGTAGFTEDTIPDEPGLELSWFVLPEQQRKGFASEITNELLQYAFDVMNASRIVAETHPENPASNQLLKKLNFSCLGERHYNHEDLPGFDTQVLWVLTRNDWGSLRTRIHRD